MTTLYRPQRIQWRRDARNGMQPAVKLYGGLVGHENFLTRQGHGEVFHREWKLGVNDGAAAAANIARFRFWSHYGVRALGFVLTFGRSVESGGPGGGANHEPYVEIDVKPAGGAVTTYGPYAFGATNLTIVDGPSTLALITGEAAINPATAYECAVRVNDWARIVSCTFFELGEGTISESTDYYNGYVAQANADIFDTTRSRILIGMSNMYRQNGGTKVHWGRRTGTARTRSIATYANIVDGTTTGTPTAATRGCTLNNEYRHTARRAVVPYEIAVYASVPAGLGNVKLMDTAGNSYGPVVVNSSTAQWFTATVNLPNDSRKYDLQLAGDGVNTLSTFFASINEREA